MFVGKPTEERLAVRIKSKEKSMWLISKAGILVNMLSLCFHVIFFPQKNV